MESLEIWIKNKDVKTMCEFFFDEKITPLQEKLIRKIAFLERKDPKKPLKLCVNAMTRWGKSYCVVRAIALHMLMNKNKRIYFMGPKQEQARILRDYLTELILKCPELAELADLDKKGVDKIKKEASRSRMTFKNGNEYRVVSAEGEADRVMGHGIGIGGGIIVKDEACLINDEANTKIDRMAGDNPMGTAIIELANPWHRDNFYFKHTENPDWEYIHIGWEDAIEDGRITKEFVETQRKELPDLSFQVLYESRFPDESEDQLIPYWAIQKAIREIPKGFKPEKKRLGCDLAEMGGDFTVLTGTEHQSNLVVVKEIKKYSKQELSETTDKIGIMANKQVYNEIIPDAIGVGAGVSSELRKRIREGKISSKLKPFKSSETPTLITDKNLYKNMKAMAYFYLREKFVEGNIIIPPEIAKEHPTLISELGKMKHGLQNGKIRIFDPGEKADDPATKKSPDFADSLMMAVFDKGTGVIIK